MPDRIQRSANDFRRHADQPVAPPRGGSRWSREPACDAVTPIWVASKSSRLTLRPPLAKVDAGDARRRRAPDRRRGPSAPAPSERSGDGRAAWSRRPPMPSGHRRTTPDDRTPRSRRGRTPADRLRGPRGLHPAATGSPLLPHFDCSRLNPCAMARRSRATSSRASVRALHSASPTRRPRDAKKRSRSPTGSWSGEAAKAAKRACAVCPSQPSGSRAPRRSSTRIEIGARPAPPL